MLTWRRRDLGYPARRWWWSPSPAVLIWVAFVVVNMLAADSGDMTWSRLTFVFGSVEAIAFAAAGACSL